ncbi:hypothetical protein [Maledivibacter halophilus]|uniref:Tetratricopeptide repeat-containing protein n=1 Tax=Maledivibacter halophilus TaxID=36842 RepID=A0A1T5LL79_9FIRM|nr:hypothetical protein [Maledivibacter halophilus]SKC76680.1 hypothetical protein SAMN02194393_03021 [Maledivibacter halophilus]
MWNNRGLLDVIKSFLPPFSKLIILEAPIKRPAVMMADLDGDGVLELIGVYNWQGENYIIVLKYYLGAWYVADIIKGKGYNITYFNVAPITGKNKNNLVIGWQVASIWSDLSMYEWTDMGLMDLIEGNKYYSMIEVKDIESKQGKDGIYELALWIHDTGDAYKVEIYRWSDDKFVLASDVYPYYYEKVVNYYKELLKENDSSTYWYYLADAQMKTGNTQEALQSIDRSLAFEYPYPSREELMDLRRDICEYIPFQNEDGIDFSDVEYICSETERDIKLEKALIKEFELEENEYNIRYYYNKVDLNEDGSPEVFVYLVGFPLCGTGGCSAAIFKQEEGEYNLLARFSLVNNPVIISDSKTKGYRDIIMYVSGGGIESFFALIKYDGMAYPSNPSIQPKVEPGTKVRGIAIVADDISKNPGITLED